MDATGLGDGSVLVLDNQTLSGNGLINGSLSNTLGSTLIISSTNATDTLTVTTNAYLAGTTVMKLDGSGTNDVLSVSNSVSFGGTLVLNNISGSPLAAGNSFKLFNAAVYIPGSSFSSIMPANPNNDPTLVWDLSQLTVSGTIGVKSANATPVPFTNPTGIVGFTLNGANIVITGTNGQSGDVYYLLTSTNVALPKSQWLTVATNVPGANGTYSFTATNVVTPGDTQQFFLLSNTNAVH